MKLAIATVAGFAAAASANHIIDLSGVAVDGAAPTVLNTGALGGGALQSIDFDFEVEAISPSWGSEINISLTHDNSGYTFTADGDDADFSDDGPADFLFGFGNASGVFSFSGSVDLSGQLADASGNWTVTLSDDFDDSVNPDHQYLQGTVTINQVPAPAGLALLGLGGMVAARRRR